MWASIKIKIGLDKNRDGKTEHCGPPVQQQITFLN